MGIHKSTEQCYIMNHDKTQAQEVIPSEKKQKQRQPQGHALRGFMKTLLRSSFQYDNTVRTRNMGDIPSVTLHSDTASSSQRLLLVPDNAKASCTRETVRQQRPTMRRYKSQPTLMSSRPQRRRNQQQYMTIGDDRSSSSNNDGIHHDVNMNDRESRWQSIMMNKRNPSCARLMVPSRGQARPEQSQASCWATAAPPTYPQRVRPTAASLNAKSRHKSLPQNKQNNVAYINPAVALQERSDGRTMLQRFKSV